MIITTSYWPHIQSVTGTSVVLLSSDDLLSGGRHVVPVAFAPYTGVQLADILARTGMLDSALHGLPDRNHTPQYKHNNTTPQTLQKVSIKQSAGKSAGSPDLPAQRALESSSFPPSTRGSCPRFFH